MIAVFPFGIPAAYFELLFLYRKRIQSDGRDTDKRIQSFRFLWGAYGPRFWFWEVVELMRKLVMEGSTLQIAIGLLACFVAFGMYALWQPYFYGSDDSLQMYCQLQLFLSLLVGLLLKVNRNVTARATLAAQEGSGIESTVFGVLLILN